MLVFDQVFLAQLRQKKEYREQFKNFFIVVQLRDRPPDFDNSSVTFSESWRDSNSIQAISFILAFWEFEEEFLLFFQAFSERNFENTPLHLTYGCPIWPGLNIFSCLVPRISLPQRFHRFQIKSYLWWMNWMHKLTHAFDHVYLLFASWYFHICSNYSCFSLSDYYLWLTEPFSNKKLEPFQLLW